MKKLLLSGFLLTAIHCALAQTDLLVLKRNNKIIQTWVPGSFIDFQFSNSRWIQGIIKVIRNDSLIIDQVVLQQVANRFGFATIDTGHLGLLKLHVNEIHSMPRRTGGSNMFSNGTLFQLGSGAYILLNLANTLIHGEPLFGSNNTSRLVIAGSIFIAGTILRNMQTPYIVAGRKYTLHTLHANSTDN